MSSKQYGVDPVWIGGVVVGDFLSFGSYQLLQLLLKYCNIYSVVAAALLINGPWMSY